MDAKTLFGFAIATGLGSLVAIYPFAVLGGLAVCLTLYGISRWLRGRLEFWQALVLFAMTAYVILNYGFDNLAVGGGGFQFPVGELGMFLALALAVFQRRQVLFREALHDPPVVCLLALLLLSCIHLVIDVPRYGAYALRDSSMFFDATFLILGVMWARSPRDTQLLMRWLFYVFVLNLLYSYTFPWGEQVQARSPASGVFHSVPLFGNYQLSALFLLLGTLYCLWVAPSVVRWPRWALMVLAVAQLGGLAILQVRTMYVGITFIILILLLLRETKKLTRFASALGLAITGLVVMVSAGSLLGIKLQGRMGPVDVSFIQRQASSLLELTDPNTRFSHDVDRSEWYGEVWNSVRSSPLNLTVGGGFGQTLINFQNDEGIAVRQPHNSSLSVLARLGFVGLSIWLLFIVLVVVRYIRFLGISFPSVGISALILWLFLHLVVALLETSVQPTLEFSHGAIPFFFLQGLAIGIMRNNYAASDFQLFSLWTSRATAQS